MNQYITNNTLRYALYFIAVLPIFIFRDFTPDNELRYLSIADEALRNGSIFTFTNHGIIYADKPPLYLWIVMLDKLIFGYHSMLFLSIFSFVPALVVVFVMDKWTKPFISESERLIGQLMLLTSGFFIGTAIVLRMDMLMCMFIVLALYTFFKMYNNLGRPRDSWLFPVFVFLAIFTKGPIGLIVPLVSTVVFLIVQKEIRTISNYWGWKTLVVLLILCGSWFAGVYAEGGSSYLNNLLFNQTVNRAVNSFHHQEPFYYYLLTFWYSLAPWSLLIFGILLSGIKKKLATTNFERFFVTILLSTLVTLSLFSSKLAVYMLPTFPFLVYLSVIWLSKLGTPRWIFILAAIPAVILCLFLPGIFVAQRFIHINGLSVNSLVILAASILSLTGILALKHLINLKLNHGIVMMGVGMLLAVFTISFSIPRFNSMIGLRELCDHAKNISAQYGVQNYYYCKMDRANNLDVYLGIMPQKLLMKDLYKPQNPIKKPAILFLYKKSIEQNDSLRLFIEGRKKYQTGKYYSVEIE